MTVDSFAMVTAVLAISSTVRSAHGVHQNREHSIDIHSSETVVRCHSGIGELVLQLEFWTQGYVYIGHVATNVNGMVAPPALGPNRIKRFERSSSGQKLVPFAWLVDSLIRSPARRVFHQSYENVLLPVVYLSGKRRPERVTK